MHRPAGMLERLAAKETSGGTLEGPEKVTTEKQAHFKAILSLERQSMPVSLLDKASLI